MAPKTAAKPRSLAPPLSPPPPPRPPQYINTDTLAKGVTKQTEKAHPGAKTTATYVVRRNGQEINRQTFLSSYKPWPARYLVGTKETGAAPPAPAETPAP